MGTESHKVLPGLTNITPVPAPCAIQPVYGRPGVAWIRCPCSSTVKTGPLDEIPPRYASTSSNLSPSYARAIYIPACGSRRKKVACAGLALGVTGISLVTAVVVVVVTVDVEETKVVMVGDSLLYVGRTA